MEAKIFEQLAEEYKVRPFRSVTMLSERGMCPSCRYVAEQFMKMYPQVEVNVVSSLEEFEKMWEGREVDK